MSLFEKDDFTAKHQENSEQLKEKNKELEAEVAFLKIQLDNDNLDTRMFNAAYALFGFSVFSLFVGWFDGVNLLHPVLAYMFILLSFVIGLMAWLHARERKKRES